MSTPLDTEALAQGLRPEFKPAALNDDGILISSNVRRIFSEALDKLEKNLPPVGHAVQDSAEYGRARALMITKLQEASMWAIRAVSTNKTNQVKGS